MKRTLLAAAGAVLAAPRAHAGPCGQNGPCDSRDVHVSKIDPQTGNANELWGPTRLRPELADDGKQLMRKLLIAASAGVWGSGMVLAAPVASAAPCDGGPGHYASVQACSDCMIAQAKAGAGAQSGPNCGLAPANTGPACNQAGVCGNGYRTYPNSCPPNAPIEQCVQPGTFPTPKAPAVPVAPIAPAAPNSPGWPSGPNDTWLR